MANSPQNEDHIEARNAQVLADMITDPTTAENLRVQMINKLLEGRDNENFFTTIFLEKLSMGECPLCGHLNHWLVPEEALNRMGWATFEEDKRVKRVTTAADCPKWAEACGKKKVVA